jgi:hypothetical protein
VPYRVSVSDWREVDGVKIPHAQEMTAGPMTLVARVTELELNKKIDPKLFALPKEARAAAGKPPAQKE